MLYLHMGQRERRHSLASAHRRQEAPEEGEVSMSQRPWQLAWDPHPKGTSPAQAVDGEPLFPQVEGEGAF